MTDGLYGDPIYPTYQTPAYGYPPQPPPEPPRRSEPWTGWVLLGLAVVAVVAAFLPWVRYSAPDGEVDHGGVVYLALAVLLGAPGTLIGLGRGRHGYAVSAFVAAAGMTVCALVALAGLSVSNAFRLDDEVAAYAGPGIWLGLVAALASGAVALRAWTVRPPVAPPPVAELPAPPWPRQ